MTVQEILNITKEKMEKSIVSLNKNLVTIRTGRANPAMLERVEADYYGSPTPINQMASIQVVEGRQLVIKPFDRTMLKTMEAALNAANLGYPIQGDGTVLRITIPPLTGDKRKEYAKDASKMGEEAKVVIRNIRRDGNDLAKKDKELTEDMKKDAQEKVQKLTDDYIKKVDAIVKEKQNEIMSI